MAFPISLDDLLSFNPYGTYHCVASRTKKGIETGVRCTRSLGKDRVKNVHSIISAGLPPDIEDPEVQPQYTELARWLICPCDHQPQADKAVAFWTSELKMGQAPRWREAWTKKDRTSKGKPTETNPPKAAAHPVMDAARARRAIEQVLEELSTQLPADASTISLLGELRELTVGPQLQESTPKRTTKRRGQHHGTAKEEPSTSSGKAESKQGVKQEPEDGTQSLTSAASTKTVIKKKDPDSAVGIDLERSAKPQLPSRSSDEVSKEDKKVRSDNCRSRRHTLDELRVPSTSDSTGRLPAKSRGSSAKACPETCPKQAIGPEHGSGPATFYDYLLRHPTQGDLAKGIMTILMKPLRGRATKSGYIYLYTGDDLPGLVKIGVTTREIHIRLKEHKRCGFTPVLVNDPKQRTIQNVFRLEMLVQKELAMYRKCRYCERCKADHQEWFEIDSQMALECIERWRKWIEQEPYDDDSGELKPMNREEFERLSSSWVKGSIDGSNMDLWERWRALAAKIYQRKLSWTRPLSVNLSF
ncbi:MAG: hypothetical protein M1816_004784 [Peltula sp. TS41687]|nr:MAG: hypothetical protein M1816_004784 [Peltula sp. TS41687]